MYPTSATALVQSHQTELLHDAQHARVVRAARAGSRRGRQAMRIRRWRPFAGRVLQTHTIHASRNARRLSQARPAT